MNNDEIKKVREYLTKTEWLWEPEHCPTDYDRSEELSEHRYYLKQALDALEAAQARIEELEWKLKSLNK
jgi:hypothetical protein